MGKNNGKKRDNRKLVRVILLNVIFVLFGLCAVGSGTYAWFAAERSASVEAGAFTIAAPDGVNYDLYYLQQFNDEEGEKQYDGNYNAVAQTLSGYYQESDYAVFAAVSGTSETSISHLWPAHKLTFAIAVTSGTLAGFNLDSWAETVSLTAVSKLSTLGATYTNVHFSWAVNIYGAAYSLTLGNDVPSALATGWSQYKQLAKADRFNYSQDDVTIVDSSNTPASMLTGSVPANANVVYFTIEFSNASSTWYSFVDRDQDKDRYVKDPVLGNSNCYEGLTLRELKFGIA